MILSPASSYANFKSQFTSLGGSGSTPIIFTDDTAVGGVFYIAVIFLSGAAALTCSVAPKPSTFDTDFPQAKQLDRILIGG